MQKHELVALFVLALEYVSALLSEEVEHVVVRVHVRLPPGNKVQESHKAVHDGLGRGLRLQ